jgi:hypothetical protein
MKLIFVFHQANKYMMNYLRKLIDIDQEISISILRESEYWFRLLFQCFVQAAKRIN